MEIGYEIAKYAIVTTWLRTVCYTVYIDRLGSVQFQAALNGDLCNARSGDVSKMQKSTALLCKNCVLGYSRAEQSTAQSFRPAFGAASCVDDWTHTSADEQPRS